jgi:hypothetical protein
VAVTRRCSHRGARALGIGVLILGVVHIPLPQADYHNIRHHDAPGEICVYHDHLLRWHPSADHDDDVSMLHWHWVVPLVEPGNPYQSSNDENHSPRSGPSLHAHFGDWPGLDWHSDPVVRPDVRGRLLDHLLLGRLHTSQAHVSNELAHLDLQSGRFSARTDYPADGVRAARTALFQRWNC